MIRTHQPHISKDFRPELMPCEKHVFENGCVLMNFHYDEVPVVKINFIFPSGKIYQNAPLVANYTGKMLFEGTGTKNQHEIASGFEIAGATVNISTNEDNATISVYCTADNVSDVLLQLHHILTESVFPEEQLRILTHNDKQEYLVNLKKVQFLARRSLFNSIFGKDHQYTCFGSESDFDSVSTDYLKSFHQKQYKTDGCLIVWVGTISDQSMALVNQLFGQPVHHEKQVSTLEIRMPDTQPETEKIQVEDARQSAIYIGRQVPGITHPDYQNISIVNTILGGYFGSRLMKNIREDKGYTYGIHSHILNYQHASLFIIGTQVKADHTYDTIDEIKKELIRLQTDYIQTDELELVKNYISGTLMQSIDGPFAQGKFYSGAFLFGVDADVLLNNFIQSIRQITPEIIKEITRKYFTPNQLFYSLSGKT